MTRQWSAIAFLSLFVMPVAADAAFITLDDYSASNPGNYTWYRAFGSGATSGFNVAGGVFDPTSPTGSTHGYTWNQGASLSPGESVRADVAIDAQGTQTGFKLSESIVGGIGGGGANPHFLLLQATSPTAYRLNLDNVTFTNLTGSPAFSAFSTLTLSRGTGVSQNIITWSMSGVRTGTSFFTYTGLLASEEVFFSLETFTGGGADTGRYDNLMFEAIPEPSSLSLLMLGATLFWFQSKRRSVR